MAGSFGTLARNAMLNYIFDNAIIVKLSTADPTADGSGLTEPVGNGYVAVTTAAADWTDAASGALSNANDITFPAASGSWGHITHFALYVAAAFKGSGELTDHRDIGAGETPRFVAGELDASLT